MKYQLGNIKQVNDDKIKTTSNTGFTKFWGFGFIRIGNF